MLVVWMAVVVVVPPADGCRCSTHQPMWVRGADAGEAEAEVERDARTEPVQRIVAECRAPDPAIGAGDRDPRTSCLRRSTKRTCSPR